MTLMHKRIYRWLWNGQRRWNANERGANPTSATDTHAEQRNGRRHGHCQQHANATNALATAAPAANAGDATEQQPNDNANANVTVELRQFRYQHWHW